jgi:hypothetical protein
MSDQGRANGMILEFLDQNSDLLRKASASASTAKNQSVINDLHTAIDRFYHPGMTEDEIKVIIANVVNKTTNTDIDSTIRAMIV